jgi:hypothetical protein
MKTGPPIPGSRPSASCCWPNGRKGAGPCVRLAPSAELTIVGEDPASCQLHLLGRLGRSLWRHIDARGWVLDNFNANPVALFGHDANTVENVIGRALNVRIEGGR